MDVATFFQCRQYLLCHMEAIPVVLRYVPYHGNRYIPKTLEGWRIYPRLGSPVPWVDTNIRTFQVMPLMWPDQYEDPSFLLPYYAAEQGIILLPDAIHHLMSGPQMEPLSLTYFNVAYEFAPPEPYCSVHTAYLAKPFLYNEWRNYIDRYFPGLIQPGGQLPVNQPGPSQMVHLGAMRHDEGGIGDSQQQETKRQRRARARRLKQERRQRELEEQGHQERQEKNFAEWQKLNQGEQEQKPEPALQEYIQSGQQTEAKRQTKIFLGETHMVSEAECQPKAVVGEERQRQIPEEEELRQRELEEHAHWERQHKAFVVRQEGRDYDNIQERYSLLQEWNQARPDEHGHREGQELKHERTLQEFIQSGQQTEARSQTQTYLGETQMVLKAERQLKLVVEEERQWQMPKEEERQRQMTKEECLQFKAEVEEKMQKMLIENNFWMKQREEYPWQLELGYQAGQSARLMRSNERVEEGHRKFSKENDREQQKQQCQELELQKQIGMEQQSSDCTLFWMPVRDEYHQERERREPMAKERRSEWFYQWKMDKEEEFESSQMPIHSRKNQQEQELQQKVDKERELERLLSQTSISTIWKKPVVEENHHQDSRLWMVCKEEDGQDENQQKRVSAPGWTSRHIDEE